jgi:phage gp29-like protein
MARTTNDPVTRGYRVYYGESEEGSDEVINEVDYSEAFGYEETKDMDYNDTVKTLEEMGVENAEERAEEFGKIRKAKKKNGILKQRLAEKETLEERQHRLMKKMVEDILTKRPKTDSDVIKNTGVSKILKKNLKSIKNIADKEGISINMLIKALKSSDDE